MHQIGHIAQIMDELNSLFKVYSTSWEDHNIMDTYDKKTKHRVSGN